MKSSSLVLMSIAVVSVGMFALPGTVSLFSGQHTWYDIAGDNLLPCQKCHADVFEELEASGFHRWNGEGFGLGNKSAPDDTACYGCHRANKSITYANVSALPGDVTPGREAHAASTVACMLCHEFNASVRTGSMEGFPAGGFAKPNAVGYSGVAPYNYTNGSTNPGGHAAHQRFIEQAINWSVMEDSNEACIACHTHAPVNITWVHAHDLAFTATWNDTVWHGDEEFAAGEPTHFNVSDWAVNGSVYNSSYGKGLNGSSSGWPT